MGHTMQTLEHMQSELRIQSVGHTNRVAKIRKEIQSLLDYEVSIAMDMLEAEESHKRVFSTVQKIAKTLSEIKQL